MFKSMFDYILGRSNKDPLVAVDIGTSAIKVMQLDLTGDKPRLINVGVTTTPEGAFNSNVIVQEREVADSIRSLLESNEIRNRKAAIALPGPCAFIKKISVATCDLKTLEKNIKFEASNYIPHNVDAVNLDYQVVSRNETTMEVLLVAVKKEIVNSYISVVKQAGLEPMVLDIDYFAIENMFELNYKQLIEQTVAMVNIGARFSSVNIVQNGESLFTGDVGVGGKLYTDALCDSMDLKPKEALQAKMGSIPEGVDANLVQETIDRTTEHIASELHRQIGFFWNAAATDKAIKKIILSGGCSQIDGLIEELTAKTGTECEAANVLSNIDCSDSFDSEFLAKIAPSMAVSVGLARRRSGDKVHA